MGKKEERGDSGQARFLRFWRVVASQTQAAAAGGEGDYSSYYGALQALGVAFFTRKPSGLE